MCSRTSCAQVHEQLSSKEASGFEIFRHATELYHSISPKFDLASSCWCAGHWLVSHGKLKYQKCEQTFWMALWRIQLCAGLVILGSLVRIQAVTGRAHCIDSYTRSLPRQFEHSWDAVKRLLEGESNRLSLCSRTLLRNAMLTARGLSTLVTSHWYPTMCSRTSCAQVHEQSSSKEASGFEIFRHTTELYHSGIPKFELASSCC